MRRILGYVDGRAQWSDNVPSTPVSRASRGGQLVVGEPTVSVRDQRRRQANALAARRYRERVKAECVLTGRCRHGGCVEVRVREARRLYATTNLTLAQIGQLMGGRDHSTITYWLNEYRDRVA